MINYFSVQVVGARSHTSFEEPTRDPAVWPAPPPRDPAVWEPPTQAPDRGSVKPIRGPKKSEPSRGGRNNKAGGSGGTAAAGKRGGPPSKDGKKGRSSNVTYGNVASMGSSGGGPKAPGGSGGSKKDDKDDDGGNGGGGVDDEGPRFDGSGYDGDLVDMLERDIVQKVILIEMSCLVVRILVKQRK